VALLVAAASAACHNNCNRKGLCSPDGTCDCFRGYEGVDCSLRSCPSGIAWSDYPTGKDEAHGMALCSNRGYCDYGSGFCACDPMYSGYACERMECPTNGDVDEFGDVLECSGHGRCMSVAAAAADFDGYFLNRSLHRLAEPGVSYTLWDADLIHGCVCDPGYISYDCSKLTCDVGDDRRTTDQRDEVATLVCQCAAPCNGTLALSFMGQESTPLKPTATADDLRRTLEALRFLHAEPGLVYPDPIAVSTNNGGPICSEGGARSKIEFLRDAGDLPPLWVRDGDLKSPSGFAYMETNQTLNCSCASCSGSFTLAYDGEMTGPLSYDASPAIIESALLSLDNLRHGDVTATSLGGNAGAGL